MKLICAAVVVTLCVQTVLSTADSDWVTWAGKFEGDIELTPLQERQILNATIANGTERNAIINTNSKWPSGRVPYAFTSVFSESEKNVVRQAIADYSANTCIQFVERNGERDYIEFIKNGGCWSYVGRRGGRQQVSLSGGCVYKYIVIHELMHAIGFFHEQSRYDRDQYVRVNLANVCCGAARNFNAYTSREVQLLGEPYDYKSVMHYGEYDFSTNRGVLKTIEALDGTSPLGNSNGFTQLDINKVNKLYQCSTTTATTDATSATTDATSATSATTDATTTSTTSTCRDRFGSNCSRWARRRLCTSRVWSNFMMDACPESCGFCAANACYDRHVRVCGLYTRIGLCNHSSYGDWMQEFCPASCGSC